MKDVISGEISGASIYWYLITMGLFFIGLFIWTLFYKQTNLIDLRTDRIVVKKWIKREILFQDITSIKETQNRTISVDQMGMSGAGFTSIFLFEFGNGKKIKALGHVSASDYHELKRNSKFIG